LVIKKLYQNDIAFFVKLIYYIPGREGQPAHPIQPIHICPITHCIFSAATSWAFFIHLFTASIIAFSNAA